jgi:hypothetical protein
MADLFILFVSILFLLITVVATAIQADSGRIPKWLLYPVSVTVGATCLYFLVQSVIGLFWITISHLPVITLFLAKIVFTMLSDPIAATITIIAVLAVLALLEWEYLFIYTLSEKARFRYQIWRSEQKRRDDYEIFRNDVKKGQTDIFEEKAKRVIR